MNRIREIRERQGLTADRLAELVGTSRPQIVRLETGARRLTVDWMRRLATALKVTPADLLSAPTLREFKEEIEPYEPEGLRGLGGALADKSLTFYRVTSDSLDAIGIAPGDVILIDMSPAAIQAVQTGDVVVVQLYDRHDLLKAVTVIRQFIAPSLLVTNKKGTNLAFQLDNDNFEAAIKGVRVQGRGGPKPS